MSESTEGTTSSGADPFLQRAEQTTEKLKPGTYDAVQALALVSIAKSLNRIAEQLELR
jgi:hypothetical protein